MNEFADTDENVTVAGRLGAAAIAVLLLVALVPLLDLRPALPALPGSRGAPDLSTAVHRVVSFTVWAFMLALVVWLYHTCLHAVLRRSPPEIPLALRRDARRGDAVLARQRRPPRNRLARPYVLTLAPRQVAPAPAPAATAAATVPATHATAVATEEERRPMPAQATQVEPDRVAIKLLGPPLIEGVPKRRRGLRGESRQLLYYLALHPNGANRDQLLGTLWPDHDRKPARQHLYQAAADARAHLGDAFQTDDDSYRLDRNLIAVDIDELDNLLKIAERSSESERRTALERALTLVRGQPLAGLDHTWAAGEARHLHATIVNLLERLGHARLDDGNPGAALQAAEQAIELDALNEALWRLAMHAEAALGLRDAIITRYENLVRLLDQRLGLQPQTETRTLYLNLLGQD